MSRLDGRAREVSNNELGEEETRAFVGDLAGLDHGAHSQICVSVMSTHGCANPPRGWSLSLSSAAARARVARVAGCLASLAARTVAEIVPSRT